MPEKSDPAAQLERLKATRDYMETLRSATAADCYAASCAVRREEKKIAEMAGLLEAKDA